MLDCPGLHSPALDLLRSDFEATRAAAAAWTSYRSASSSSIVPLALAIDAAPNILLLEGATRELIDRGLNIAAGEILADLIDEIFAGNLFADGNRAAILHAVN